MGYKNCDNNLIKIHFWTSVKIFIQKFKHLRKSHLSDKISRGAFRCPYRGQCHGLVAFYNYKQNAYITVRRLVQVHFICSKHQSMLHKYNNDIMNRDNKKVGRIFFYRNYGCVLGNFFKTRLLNSDSIYNGYAF